MTTVAAVAFIQVTQLRAAEPPRERRANESRSRPDISLSDSRYGAINRPFESLGAESRAVVRPGARSGAQGRSIVLNNFQKTVLASEAGLRFTRCRELHHIEAGAVLSEALIR